MADMFDKEELSIVGGLFPNALATAEAEKLAQQESAYKRFSGAAGTQNPFGGLAGLSGMFGTAAGQELRGLAGAQSPTMQLVSLRDQAAKQFDTRTPQGLIQMAQFLNQQGDAAGARQAIMVAQGQNRRALEAEKLQGEIGIQGREIKEIGVPNNPDLLQKAVVDKEGNIIRRVGEPYNRFTNKQNISVDAKGETEFVKKLAGLDAKRVNDAADARDNAIAGLTNLNQLSSLNEKDLIGGAFATTRVGAVNFLNTLGLTGAADIDKLARSEQYAKTASDLVLQTLGGRLGAGFSNEDRKFIEKIVPQLENSATARRQLLTFMQTKFTNVVNEADRLETYARENNSLKGYKYTTPLPKAPSTKPQFTRQELEAALEKKLNEGKK
jgi:hypothetical protein